MKKKVAYSTTSPDWSTPSALEEYYKGYTLDSNYYDTFHGINNWKIGKSWNRLPFPVDEREWASNGYPEQFNAQYSLRENLVSKLNTTILYQLLTTIVDRNSYWHFTITIL